MEWWNGKNIPKSLQKLSTGLPINRKPCSPFWKDYVSGERITNRQIKKDV